jgi:hypothetical protein
MPCNVSYARFIFGKFFTSTIILYVLLFAQNFYSCKKWVLQLGIGGFGWFGVVCCVGYLKVFCGL